MNNSSQISSVKEMQNSRFVNVGSERWVSVRFYRLRSHVWMALIVGLILLLLGPEVAARSNWDDGINNLLEDAKVLNQNREAAQTYSERIKVAKQALTEARQRASDGLQDAYLYFEATRLILECAEELEWPIPSVDAQIEPDTLTKAAVKATIKVNNVAADAFFWSRVTSVAAAVHQLGQGMERFNAYERHMLDEINGNYSDQITGMEERLASFNKRNDAILERVLEGLSKADERRTELKARQAELRRQYERLHFEHGNLQNRNRRIESATAAYKKDVRAHKREGAAIASMKFDRCPVGNPLDICEHPQKDQWIREREQRKRKHRRQTAALDDDYRQLQTARSELSSRIREYEADRGAAIHEDGELKADIDDFKRVMPVLAEIRMLIKPTT